MAATALTELPYRSTPSSSEIGDILWKHSCGLGNRKINGLRKRQLMAAGGQLQLEQEDHIAGSSLQWSTKATRSNQDGQ